jgi:type IV pilus assembly protein PilE
MHMKKLLSGFTLIELLVTIAIVGILYSIAVPKYTHYIQDARRSEVQNFLVQQVAILERSYTRLGGYPGTYVASVSDYYSFDYQHAASGAAANDSATFTLTATPISSSAQKGDRCGVMSVNHQGTTTATSADCWH